MTLTPHSACQAYEDASRRYIEITQMDDLSGRMAALKEVQLAWATAVSSLQAVKDEAVPEVWFHLAEAYFAGRGVRRDVEEGTRWMRAAAEAGFTRAMVRMGISTRQTDPVAALAWHQKAADAGDPGGMVFLGFAYREGDGTPCDFVKSAHWFERAALAGDKHAWVHAGRVHLRHLKNDHEAFRCLTAADEAGMKDCHLDLAFLHEDPQSPLHDMAKAVAWYQNVAAESSSSQPRAMIALARFYRAGQGVSADLDAARGWLRQALESSPGSSTFQTEAKKLLEKWKDEIV